MDQTILLLKVTKMRYSVIKKDINQLPLGELGKQFLALRNLSWSKHVAEQRQLAIDRGDEVPSNEWMANSFRTLGSAEKLELEVLISRFAETFQIPRNANWFFPQCLAVLAKIKLPRNDKGLISARELIKEHYIKDTFIMGIYTLFVYAKRGLLLKNQTSEASRNFSKLVPLIMSAYKQYSNVQYAEWDPEEAHLVVDADLWEAMSQATLDESLGWYYSCLDRGYLPESNNMFSDEKDTGEDFGGFALETILGWRNDALTVKTGDKRGSIRSPVSTYSMSPSIDNPMHYLDQLSRHMFLQTWCAHPDNRTALMVLHPLAWDFMPKPLIDIKFLHPTAEQEATQYHKALEEQASYW